MFLSVFRMSSNLMYKKLLFLFPKMVHEISIYELSTTSKSLSILDDLIPDFPVHG